MKTIFYDNDKVKVLIGVYKNHEGIVHHWSAPSDLYIVVVKSLVNDSNVEIALREHEMTLIHRPCPNCNDHGGTYEMIEGTGDIAGIQCEVCNSSFKDE